MCGLHPPGAAEEQVAKLLDGGTISVLMVDKHKDLTRTIPPPSTFPRARSSRESRGFFNSSCTHLYCVLLAATEIRVANMSTFWVRRRPSLLLRAYKISVAGRDFPISPAKFPGVRWHLWDAV